MESDYVFGDSENRPPFMAPGDTMFEVVEIDTKISGGGKTAGSRQVGLCLQLVPSGVICYDQLLFHSSTAWKVDTFVKACGIAAKKGETPVEMVPGNEHMLVGLRGWCTVAMDDYVPKGSPPGTKPKERNKVVVWLTNKEKLARRPLTEAEQKEDDAPF